MEKTKNLKVGDPLKEDTNVGPLIGEPEAVRLVDWVEKAMGDGAKLLCGGKREGALMGMLF